MTATKPKVVAAKQLWFLHWLMAFCFLPIFILGIYMAQTELPQGAYRSFVYRFHESMGMLVLLLLAASSDKRIWTSKAQDLISFKDYRREITECHSLIEGLIMKSKTRRNIIVGSAATLTGLAVAGVTSTQTNAQQSATATAPSPTGRFNGKVVLITGATSGIGRATAFAFAREGAKVVFCGRRVNLGEQVATEIKQEGGEALYVQADVLKSADIEALVATTVKTYGRLDIAFNNAGVVANAPIHETPEEQWDRIVGTNLKGMWLSMKYEIGQMLKQKSGVIVNNASMHAFSTRAGASPYAASKHGILGITKAVALEIGTSGIRVNTIAPGPIDTPMLRGGIGGTPEGRARFAEDTAGLKRIGTADEVAKAVLWLSSDDSSYITGTSLLIDGGTVAAL